jgi:hypothetical protein
MFAVAVLGLLLASGVAQADTFVWRDVVNDFTMSFPDSWRVQTDDVGYTRLRIAGPLAEDEETCRMNVRHDGRIKIYPKRLMGVAVMEKLDHDFWDKEVAQFRDAKISNFYAPASLGSKGDATAVAFSYTLGKGDDKYSMLGVSVSSIYDGKRYTVTCSSRATIYSRYADLFLSIIDSVELEQKYHPFPTGYYRNFLLDPKLVLPRSQPGTANLYAKPSWKDRYLYNN